MPRQVDQQAVAKAFIGNAVKIRGSPLYCEDDERPYTPLSGGPDGKAGVRRNPSQETSRLWCVHDLSVGKAVQCRPRLALRPITLLLREYGGVFLRMGPRVKIFEKEICTMKRLAALFLSLTLLLGLAACGQTQTPAGGSTETPPVESAQPAETNTGAVTVTNGGRELTFDSVPERVVCLNMQMTEMMLTLGLEEHVIYTCYTNAEPIPEMADTFNQIPLLSERYPSLEVLLSTEPDLVLGQRFGFTEDHSGTVETLAEHGVPAYVSTGTLAASESVEDIYQDLRDLGAIFRVEDRAEEVISEMQAKVADIAEKVSTLDEKATVFVVDSIKENEIYTSAKSMETEVIKLAGGISACEGDSDEQWYYVSMETLLEKDPDYILCNDYGSVNAEETIAALKANPALANLDAVKNDRFLTTVLQDVNESVRVADTACRFAQEMYPELFE